VGVPDVDATMVIISPAGTVTFEVGVQLSTDPPTDAAVVHYMIGELRTIQEVPPDVGCIR